MTIIQRFQKLEHVKSNIVVAQRRVKHLLKFEVLEEIKSHNFRLAAAYFEVTVIDVLED